MTQPKLHQNGYEAEFEYSDKTKSYSGSIVSFKGKEIDPITIEGKYFNEFSRNFRMKIVEIEQNIIESKSHE